MDVDGDVEIQMEQDFDEPEEFPFEANHSEAELNPPGKSPHRFSSFLNLTSHRSSIERITS